VKLSDKRNNHIFKHIHHNLDKKQTTRHVKIYHKSYWERVVANRSGLSIAQQSEPSNKKLAIALALMQMLNISQ
jgi:hypothetical protein